MQDLAVFIEVIWLTHLGTATHGMAQSSRQTLLCDLGGTVSDPAVGIAKSDASLASFGTKMPRLATHRPVPLEVASGDLRDLVVHRYARLCTWQRTPLGDY